MAQRRCTRRRSACTRPRPWTSRRATTPSRWRRARESLARLAPSLGSTCRRRSPWLAGRARAFISPQLQLDLEQVGIEDCLHIEFEYNKSRYHLREVVLGKIFFLLVRIRIKHMELAIIKRESSGVGANAYTESDTVAKYEIMDGAPVRGEAIPIRLFLSGFDQLTPTFRNVNNKFSVRYFLNLVLVDEEDRRYFKQQEVFFYRKGP
mmetsp:Transcript_7247/g.23187  ORF Transcript_7247/g.23187 Transcript_7247/m.23187 type:complete len:207 (-) Transcript_7247:196-816(-)